MSLFKVAVFLGGGKKVLKMSLKILLYQPGACLMFLWQVPIKAVQGHLYVRISAHVYNTLEEYEQLADAITQLANDCSWRQNIVSWTYSTC